MQATRGESQAWPKLTQLWPVSDTLLAGAVKRKFQASRAAARIRTRTETRTSTLPGSTRK